MPPAGSSVLGLFKSFGNTEPSDSEILAPLNKAATPSDVGASIQTVPSPALLSAVSLELAEDTPSENIADTVVVRGRLRLGGQSFLVEHAEDCVYLRHPRWSLLGVGPSLLDAEKDLRSEILELRRHLDESDKRTFSSDLLALHDFAFRVG